MSQSPIIWLPNDFDGEFPPVEYAMTEPDGLLAAGANLNVNTLLRAYKKGIFPWYSYEQPILWWSPDPRCVLFPDKIHISHSLKKTLNKNTFNITVDSCFRDTMLACAGPRKNDPGTWINEDILEAYCVLHELGYAHSVESWLDDQLVGGLYGVTLGSVFFGESMFSRTADASKVALHYLCTEIRPSIIDAQIHSKHVESMGAELIPREQFISILDNNCSSSGSLY